MTFPLVPSSLFDLRCRTRREVAEALSLLPAESRHAGQLREGDLAALDSAASLRGVGAAARDLAWQARRDP